MSNYFISWAPRGNVPNHQHLADWFWAEAEELLEEKEDEEAALPLVGHLLQLPGSPQKVAGENSTPPKMAWII